MYVKHRAGHHAGRNLDLYGLRRGRRHRDRCGLRVYRLLLPIYWLGRGVWLGLGRRLRGVWLGRCLRGHDLPLEYDFALHFKSKERAAFWCQSQGFKALAWRGQPFGCRKLWKRKMRALA